MREINFKGWLVGIGKMTYPHSLEELMNWNTKPEDNGSATWLQYTGLNDRNGKEIYENDIVSWHGKSDPFVIEWVDMDAAFAVADISTGRTHYEYIMSDLHEAEVLGNIYENAEFLRIAPSSRAEA